MSETEALTKREYVATAIMAGMCANTHMHADATHIHLAIMAVGAADALIRELKKESNQ